MKKDFWRISYNKIGVYEALKKEIWSICKEPKEVWDDLKLSSSFTWLKTPPTYPSNSYSYFTELGYKLFMEKTYPILIKYLDPKKMVVEKFIFDNNEINIIYEDEHQIVVGD